MFMFKTEGALQQRRLKSSPTDSTGNALDARRRCSFDVHINLVGVESMVFVHRLMYDRSDDNIKLVQKFVRH